MVKRKTKSNESCPVARVLDVIGDRWSLMIIRDAFDGTRRFGVFQKNLGVARNILTDRLRNLVAEDILKMIPASDGTFYWEYALTQKGESLFAVLVALRQWGEDYLYSEGEEHSVMIEQQSGKPIPRIALHTIDGRTLGPKDTVVKKLLLSVES